MNRCHINSSQVNVYTDCESCACTHSEALGNSRASSWLNPHHSYFRLFGFNLELSHRERLSSQNTHDIKRCFISEISSAERRMQMRMRRHITYMRCMNYLTSCQMTSIRVFSLKRVCNILKISQTDCHLHKLTIHNQYIYNNNNKTGYYTGCTLLKTKNNTHG